MDNPARWVFRLTKLVAFHRTWFMADVFINVGFIKTGTSKTEFNRMIGECEGGNIDIILTKNISRFGRYDKDGLETIRKIQAAGKRIIFEKDKIDTETVKEELLISIIEACDQVENDWKSENIR